MYFEQSGALSIEAQKAAEQIGIYNKGQLPEDVNIMPCHGS